MKSWWVWILVCAICLPAAFAVQYDGSLVEQYDVMPEDLNAAINVVYLIEENIVDGAVIVDIVPQPGSVTYNDVSHIQSESITGNFQSYLLHWNAVGGAGDINDPNFPIIFPQPIVGVIVTSARLNTTDAIYGLGDYPQNSMRGLELNVAEWIRINGNELEFRFQDDELLTDTFDQVRILTGATGSGGPPGGGNGGDSLFCPIDQVIVRLYQENNTHVALPAYTNLPEKICYTDVFGATYETQFLPGQGVPHHICTGDNLVLRLSHGHNAHAQAPDYTGEQYPVDVCFGDMVCQTRQGSCDEGEHAFLSMSGLTNAHVSADPDYYDTKLCCTSVNQGCPTGFCKHPDTNLCYFGGSPPTSFSFAYFNNTHHMCQGGEWLPQVHYDPFKRHAGYCEQDSQCFWHWTGIPGDPETKCIDSGDKIGPYICQQGNWSSSAKILGETLEQVFSELQVQNTDYTMLCGTPTDVLNFIDTNNAPPPSQLSSFLGGPGYACQLGATPVTEHCVHRACALQYNYGGNSHSVILGFTIEDGMTQSDFENAFGVTCNGSTCAGEYGHYLFFADAGFLLYVPYDNSGFATLLSWINNMFNTWLVGPLFGAFNLLFGSNVGEQLQSGDSLYDTFYRARFGTGSSQFIVDATKDQRYSHLEASSMTSVVVRYSGNDVDFVCNQVARANERFGEDAYVCELDGDAVIVYGERIGSSSSVAIDNWLALTAQLRPRQP